MKAVFVILSFLLSSPIFAGDLDHKEYLVNGGPLVAQAGKCYTHVIYPPKYVHKRYKILTKEASSRFVQEAAKYRYVEKTVLVEEAREEVKVIPAKYKKVKVRVLKKPAATKIVEVPAQYGVQQVRVKVKDSEVRWRQGHSLGEDHQHEDGVVCAEEHAAQYKTIERKVLISPARVEKVEMPAEYGYVVRTVVEQPQRHEVVQIPAKYKKVRVKELVSDAQEIEVEVPAEYSYVVKKEVERPSYTQWEEVICKNNINSLMIMEIQKGLQSRGYNLSVDGVFGEETKAALRHFQKTEGLPYGYLTKEGLEKLGLSL